MTTITTFQNNRNEHKYIDVKHASDGHYLWRQRMRWENGVENHIGTRRGGFRRMRKAAIAEVIDNDYAEVSK